MTQSRAGVHSPTTSGSAAGRDLFDVVEHELIPRLLMLDSVAAGLSAPQTSRGLFQGSPQGPAESPNPVAHQLALLTLEAELPDCQAYLEGLRDKGLSLEEIFLDVLQPAARILGSRWKEDSCSFVDVTTGLWQLQQIFHQLLYDFQAERPSRGQVETSPAGHRPTAFFCTLPGAQHRLGVQMVSAFFCRAGWQTSLSPSQSLGQILEDAQRFTPDLLGVSISCEREMHEAPAFILALRKATKKSNPILMIGGPGPSLFPELAQACQADFVSGDAPSALTAAHSHLQSRRGKASA